MAVHEGLTDAQVVGFGEVSVEVTTFRSDFGERTEGVTLGPCYWDGSQYQVLDMWYGNVPHYGGEMVQRVNVTGFKRLP